MFCHLRGQPGTCLRFGARCRSFTGNPLIGIPFLGGLHKINASNIFTSSNIKPSLALLQYLGLFEFWAIGILQFPRSVGAGSDHRTIGRRKTWDRVEDWSGAIENIPVECELFSDNWTYDLSINISSGVLRF